MEFSSPMHIPPIQNLRVCFVLCLALLFFSLASTKAFAGYGNVYGMGPVSVSMGTTSLRKGKISAFHAHQNPAMLGYAVDSEISVGLVNTDPHLNGFGTVVVDDSGTLGVFDSSGVLGGKGQSVGILLPLGKKSRPLSLGINIYLSGKSLSRVSGPPVNHPFYPLYQDVSRNTSYTVSLGYRVWQGLSIGFTGTTSLVSLADYQLTSNSSVSFSASAVEVRTVFRPGFALVYDTGFQEGEISDAYAWLFGLMYRPKSELTTKLTANVEVSGIPISGELNSFPQFSPAELTFSASKRVSEALVLAADVSYVEWSAYKNPFGDGNINSFIFGSGNTDAGFENRIVPKLGAEYSWKTKESTFKQWSLRTGYFYSQSPVPDQVLDSNFADSTRHGISFGLGTSIKNPWIENPATPENAWIDFDMFVQLNHLEKRDVVKASSTNLGAPGYTMGGNIWVYGLHTSLNF